MSEGKSASAAAITSGKVVAAVDDLYAVLNNVLSGVSALPSELIGLIRSYCMSRADWDDRCFDSGVQRAMHRNAYNDSDDDDSTATAVSDQKTRARIQTAKPPGIVAPATTAADAPDPLALDMSWKQSLAGTERWVRAWGKYPLSWTVSDMSGLASVTALRHSDNGLSTSPRSAESDVGKGLAGYLASMSVLTTDATKPKPKVPLQIGPLACWAVQVNGSYEADSLLIGLAHGVAKGMDMPLVTHRAYTGRIASISHALCVAPVTPWQGARFDVLDAHAFITQSEPMTLQDASWRWSYSYTYSHWPHQPVPTVDRTQFVKFAVDTVTGFVRAWTEVPAISSHAFAILNVSSDAEMDRAFRPAGRPRDVLFAVPPHDLHNWYPFVAVKSKPKFRVTLLPDWVPALDTMFR